MTPTQDQVLAGQAVYTSKTLSLYDFIVLGISNRYIWKCPTPLIEAHYNAHVTANHLDVGVGSGYFPDHCQFPTATPRVALMDMNDSTLVYASERIARYSPETYRQNVLEPMTAVIKPFDSLGINYLFHCVPGSISEKAIAFDHLIPLMNSGATVFGSTILQGDVPRNWMAKKLMGFYNKKGIFSNSEDTLFELKQALEQRFDKVTLQVQGCVALFSAKVR